MSGHSFTALFLFAGIGAGALGFLRAQATLNGARSVFRSLGGVDNDPVACRDFEKLTKSPALCADLSRLAPAALRDFAGDRAPDVVFMSPPCKGFSGLMSPTRAKTPKYQAMNRLALAGINLVLDAWAEDPPGLILLENVPRIATRGAPLLREIRAALRARGYVTHEGSHDCGELGGLAQHRQRFLLVARHAAKVPVFLYQPVKRPVRACGEVLGALPLPNDPQAGRLHRLPAVSMLNWLRLAAIPPGGDWRDLPGVLGEEQARHEGWGRYGVLAWGAASGAVAGGGTNGPFGVADPRVGPWYGGVLGVARWDAASCTVTGRATVSTGTFAVADPRLVTGYPHTYGVLGWDAPSHAVTAKAMPGTGPFSVADPRLGPAPGQTWFKGKHGVLAREAPARTVIGGPSNGADAVADLRLGCAPWENSGAYGVLSWWAPARTVTGSLCIDNGFATVADPRVPGGPVLALRWCPLDLGSAPPFAPVLPTRDGSWHRPLTTLELAVLQGLPAELDGAPLDLAGPLTLVREHIGNAVPVPAAEAIAGEMLRTLALARAGAFMLSSAGGVWVRKGRHGAFPLYPSAEDLQKRARPRRRPKAAPRGAVRAETSSAPVWTAPVPGGLQ